MRSYLSILPKDSVTHMHDLAAYVKEGCPFARISRKLYGFLLMFSAGFTSFSVLLFFLYRSPSSSLYSNFDAVSSNTDEILSIGPSANELFN